jgi:2-polyprenyl-3-methyl-5-hydroxy-6-metoxy-1,4-benzoquinol methylase
MSGFMKILAVISNYGTSNNEYLQEVLRELRGMTDHHADIVVLSDTPKDFGADIKVQVGLPSKDPWTLPFAHKDVFVQNINAYDLFLYNEDDIRITEAHINAFLEATKVLHDDEIAGFMRYEVDSAGLRYFCDVHGRYRWDPRFTRQRGAQVFGFFTNEHAGCFLLTQDQLRRSIASGGFRVPPHKGRYGLPESAATDPYTQCGFRKMISLTNFEDFMVHHMSNKYVGKSGLENSDMYKQIRILMGSNGNLQSEKPLFEIESKTLHSRCSKSYYEPYRRELVSLIPQSARSVLSVGCGWGVTEAALQESQKSVTAIPLDSVIAPLAEARGLKVIQGSLESARAQLQGEKFDCLLFSHELHLFADPVAVLRDFAPLLGADGCVVASVPNLAQASVAYRRATGDPEYRNLSSYESAGFHLTSRRTLESWFAQSGFKLEQAFYEIPERAKFADRLSLGMAGSLLGSKLNVRASKN